VGTGLAPQSFHHPLPGAGLGGAFSGPAGGIGPPLSNINSPLPTSPAGLRVSPPLPYLPPARRQEVNSSPEGSIPTAPSPLPMASVVTDSPQAVTPPPPLLIGTVGGGWPNSSFFHLPNSPQHRGQQQQQNPLGLGQLRPAVPPFGGAFSPFQVGSGTGSADCLLEGILS
jgi:hypothetical protein